MANERRLLSLFSGCGGFDLGFEITGRWRTVIANDLHPMMCETLRRNQGLPIAVDIGFLSDSKILEGDIRSLNIGQHEQCRDIDLVLGGPPCQSFSVMGKHSGYDDGRGSLIYEFANIVRTVRPKLFLFENVPNMRAGKWKDLFIQFLHFLSFEGDYRISNFLLCCADYGAATIRRRIFVVGARSDLDTRISMPAPTHRPRGTASLFGDLKEYVSANEAFAGLPAPTYHFSYPDLHFAPRHDVDTVERFKTLAHGATDHKRKRDRLHPDEPALTLMSGGEAGGTRAHIHPFEPREITPREAARLHGIPDLFTFAGNKSQIAIQISNSVPVPMAAAWANHLANRLDELEGYRALQRQGAEHGAFNILTRQSKRLSVL